MLGHRRRLAGVGVLLGGLALLGVAAVATNDAGQEPAPAILTTQVYDRSDGCDTPCFVSAATDPFSVGRDLAEIQLVIYVVLEPATGPAQVTVRDPAGDVRYERLFTADGPRGATQDVATWRAEPGEWTLTRSYLGTVGTVSYDAWVVAHPE